MFTIKSAHADSICAIEFYNKRIKDLSENGFITVSEYDLEDTPISKIKELLNENKDVRFNIEDGHSCLVVKKQATDSMVRGKIAECKNGIEYQLKKLKKWALNSEESKNQILHYAGLKEIEINLD